MRKEVPVAIEIAPTPVVTGKSARRLTRIMFANRHKKVGLTPTPRLAELTEKILKFQGGKKSGGESK